MQGRGVTGAAPAPMAAAEGRFEDARKAAAQRAAISLEQADAIAGSAVGSGTKRVDGRTFVLKGDTWTDVRWRDSMKTVAVKPFSTEYFELMSRVPELKAVFALGEKVVVAGREIAVRLDASAGAADVEGIVSRF